MKIKYSSRTLVGRTPASLIYLSLHFIVRAQASAAEIPAVVTPHATELKAGETRWNIDRSDSTTWRVAGSKLPHKDFIEQGGRRVGQKVWYAVAADGTLGIKRDVVWPSLRVNPNNTRGSLIKHYADDSEPKITMDGHPLGPIQLAEVKLDGVLTFVGTAGVLAVQRVTFPSLSKYSAVDRWMLTNRGTRAVALAVAPVSHAEKSKPGPYGLNIMEVSCDAPPTATLEPGQSLSFSVLFSARQIDAVAEKVDGATEEKARRDFIAELNGTLQLETPDPLLNRAFTFAKWRVAEAINDTRGGMMLAPGNLNYYAATWCNDNVEYAGPFFPFLGEAGGIAGSLNAYRQYIPYMKSTYTRIPCSIVAEGTGTWGPFDRGDAAMYAYGASRFSLAQGDQSIGEELWKGIEWTLEYCRRMLTTDGVVASERDELEGRLPSGKANLTTSSLYYGGLRSAANLGRALGKNELAKDYDQRADVLAKAIEAYFGATVEGFATYRYYDPLTVPLKKGQQADPSPVLRSWICMPLSMGISDRKEGTIDALFSPKMWMPDGLASKSGDKVFWDRSTLYAIRSVFQAGETEKALDYLSRYTRRRLLGNHVPYPVEAYPEGGQGHLAAESGLYCRIYIEGMFGILPTGLDRFRCTPRLPKGWTSMALRRIQAFRGDFDLVVSRQAEGINVQVLQQGKTVQNATISDGGWVDVVVPPIRLPVNDAVKAGPNPQKNTSGD